MKPNPEKINSLLEAQYHFFESGQVDEAARVVDVLMNPLYGLGRYPELLGLLEKTIENVEDPDNRFYIFQARALMALGRPDDALAILEVVPYVIGDDPELRAAILIDKGTSLRRLGEFSRADEILEDFREANQIYAELIPEAESEEDKRLFRGNQGTCLFGEGNIYQYFLENPGQALELYGQARAVFAEVESADGIADATKQMGEIYATPTFSNFYDSARANEALETALKIYRENNYQKGVLETLYQLGRLHRGEPERARELFSEYLNLAETLGLIREEAVAKRHLAELQFEATQHLEGVEPDYNPTINLLGEAIPVLQLFKFDIWSQKALMNCYYVLGEIWAVLKNDEIALQSFQEGVRVGHNPVFDSRREGDLQRRLRLLLKAVQILFRLDRSHEAESLMMEHADDFKHLELPVPSSGGHVLELITHLTKGG
jgi:tetratricopeptide (TPR) repeat protein